MTDGNIAPNYGVTTEMLDQLQQQRVAAIIRVKEEQKAKEEWPGRVNAILRALGEKVIDLELRLAAVETSRS